MKNKKDDPERERKILSYQSALKEKARLGLWRSRALKRRATIPEKTLLEALRKQHYWLKFQPYFYTDKHLYIPDFRLATAQYKLLVEVDGPSHNQQHAYDEARTAWLKQHRNCVVLRFTNEQVMTEIEMVLETIAQHDPLRIGEQRTTLSQYRLKELERVHQYAEDCDPEMQFMRHIKS